MLQNAFLAIRSIVHAASPTDDHLPIWKVEPLMPYRLRSALLAGIVALPMVGYAIPAKAANKALATANAVAELVAKASTEVDLVEPTTTNAVTSIETATQVVELGQTVSDPVVIGDGALALKITLPQVSDGLAVTAQDGTIVYAGDQVSTSVQVGEAGNVRAAVTLHDETAPRDYEFVIDVPNGMTLNLNDQGGIDIVGLDEGPTFGSIDAPWAKDASGKSLPTHYTLDGDRVTQHVNTEGAIFPVVADPDVKYNCGITSCNATFSRWYTKNVLQPSISGVTAAGGIIAGALLCGKIPVAPVAAVCAAAAAVIAPAAVIKINEASAKNQCFTIRFGHFASPTYSSVGVNSDKNCKDR